MSLTIGSLFSGIGGLELGLERAGFGPVIWQVEREPFCLRVLAKHWPNAERFTDVRAFRSFPAVDVICGGFPCQDVSAAGKGEGLTGARSGLWWEFARIIAEVRPRAVVVENVASGASRWLCQVRTHLHQLGYRTRALGISAADVGAPHLRRRIFIIAHAERQLVRKQSRRRSGQSWQGQTFPWHDGQTWDRTHTERKRREAVCAPLADADGVREPQPEGREQELWRRPSDGRWWATESGVDIVAHGISGRLARLKAIGNAVVPQCSEIAGRALLRELAQ